MIADIGNLYAMGVVVPRTGSTLDPEGVEFVAAALARCHERMLADISLRDQAAAHDAILTRYLMSRVDAGERDVEALALRAIDKLRAAIRRKSEKELRGATEANAGRARQEA